MTDTVTITDVETAAYTSDAVEHYMSIYRGEKAETKEIANWGTSNKVFQLEHQTLLKTYLQAKGRNTMSTAGAAVLFMFSDSPLASVTPLIYDRNISDLIITSTSIKGLKGTEALFELPIYPEVFNYIENSLQSYAQMKVGPENPFLNSQFEHTRINMTSDRLTGDGQSVIVMRIDQGGIIDAEMIESQLSPEVISQYEDFANNPEHSPGHIFVGVTGSGKTTMLRYFLSKKKDGMSNLVTIEDINELKIENALSLVSSNTTSISQLFINSLRQAPTSLVIGEARDEVLLDIFEAGLVFPAFTTIHSSTFFGFLLRSQLMTRKVIDSHNLMKLIGEVIGGVTIMRNQRPYEIWKINGKNAECTWGDSLGDVVNIYDWA